jgi:S1-C subfamily serine protease
MQELRIGGDVLTAMDGQPIASQLDMNVLLNRHRPSDTVTLTVYRGKQKMDLRVTLGER